MEVSTTDFYRDPDPQMCQGDIIVTIPHVFLQQPIRVLRPVTATKLGLVLQPFDLDTPPEDGFRFVRDQPEEVSASCLLTTGILLTHGCEIDKDGKHRMIALVRPLSRLHPSDAEKIRKHTIYRYFYLPADEGRLEESYVDFRRVSSVAPELIPPEQRIASLTEFGRKQLLMKFFMYVTRVSPEAVDSLLIPR